MLVRRATHKFLRFGKENTRDLSAHRFIYLSFYNSVHAHALSLMPRCVSQISSVDCICNGFSFMKNTNPAFATTSRIIPGGPTTPATTGGQIVSGLKNIFGQSSQPVEATEANKSKQKWRRRLKIIAADTVFLSQ